MRTESKTITRRRLAAGLLGAAAFARTAAAAGTEVRVVSSGGFAAAYRALTPQFERMSGDRLITEWGPSMGATPGAIPARLARGEPIDAVVMVAAALDRLVAAGTVMADSRTDLARSGIGAAVRQGAPKPDIGTVAALRSTLLAARSVAYSDSASGVYLRDTLFPRLGIAAEMARTARMIPAEPVGAVVARGEAELGFQQLSELRPIAGIDLLGPLPAEVQKYTLFAAGVPAAARQPAAARALIRFLASPDAATAIVASGMEPASRTP